MEKIQKLGLLAFMVYLPIFVLAIGWLAPKRYQGFSFQTHWISNLGEKASASYPYFVIGFNLLAVLGIFFLVQLAKVLPKNLVGKSTLFFLALGLICCSLITFFPVDTDFSTHNLIARILTVCLLFANLLAIGLNLTKLPWPKLLSLLSVLVIALIILFGASMMILMKKYTQLELTNFAEIYNQEESFFLKINTIWEWLLMFFQMVWLFLASLFLFGEKLSHPGSSTAKVLRVDHRAEGV